MIIDKIPGSATAPVMIVVEEEDTPKVVEGKVKFKQLQYNSSQMQYNSSQVHQTPQKITTVQSESLNQKGGDD